MTQPPAPTPEVTAEQALLLYTTYNNYLRDQSYMDEKGKANLTRERDKYADILDGMGVEYPPKEG